MEGWRVMGDAHSPQDYTNASLSKDGYHRCEFGQFGSLTLLGRLSPDVAPHSWDFLASKAMSQIKVYCPELTQHQLLYCSNKKLTKTATSPRCPCHNQLQEMNHS